MIELEKIEKIYNAGKASETHALKDINLRIEEGDMVAITGPSGSGKNQLCCILLQELIRRVPGNIVFVENWFLICLIKKDAEYAIKR